MEELSGRHYRILVSPTFEPTDLDAYEKARSEKRKVESDRQMSAAAMSLAHRLGSGPVRHDEKGRPVAAMELSLSHKSGWVVAATVASDYRIGVDVENASSLKNPQRFAQRALAPRERANLDTYQQSWKCSEIEAIVTLWSLKECFYKATRIDPGPANTEFFNHGIVIAAGRPYPVVESLVQIREKRILCALVFKQSDL